MNMNLYIAQYKALKLKCWASYVLNAILLLALLMA